MSAGKTVVTLGTATPGGGFPLYGGAVAEALGAADPSLGIETRNTKGSTENVPLLERGALDLALVQGEVAYQALLGIGRPASAVKILWAMYSTAGMFVVRADSPCRRIGDLAGRRVAFGARGSGLVILSRYVLDGLGLDQDRDFDAVYLDRAGDGPAMVIDGSAVALWGGGIGWPGFTAVAAAPGGARFIAPDAQERARILARHAFLKELTVAADAYRGQEAPIRSVGSWSVILARPGLDALLGYRLAHALHRAEAALGLRLAQARESTAANTLAAAPAAAMLHPGVLRCLKEIGLIVG